jgi:hypothetical protein
MKIKRFPVGQKFRVIIGDVSFYATAKQIRWGVGDIQSCNRAVLHALVELENTRSSNDYMANSTGIGTSYDGVQVQLSMM